MKASASFYESLSSRASPTSSSWIPKDFDTISRGIECKMDRAFVNFQFSHTNQDLQGSFLEQSLSDHKPMLITMNQASRSIRC